MAGSARLRQCDGLQATANGVSKRRPNFHHQLLSAKAVPDVANDKGFRVVSGEGNRLVILATHHKTYSNNHTQDGGNDKT